METQIVKIKSIDKLTPDVFISDFNQQFYVCGPPPMMDAVLKQLANMGVDKKAITVEI